MSCSCYPVLKKLFKKLEEECEKEKHCPTCGWDMHVDDVDTNPICHLQYRSCSNPKCDFKDTLTIPIFEPPGVNG